MYTHCNDCKMILLSDTQYHPYAACVLYRQLGQADKVEDCLRSVIEYGIRAGSEGLSAESALRDIRRAGKEAESL